MKSGLTNGEGMALNQSPEAAIAMFYSEIKFFDFNNPVRIQSGPKVNGRLSKHLKLSQWEPRKNQSLIDLRQYHISGHFIHMFFLLRPLHTRGLEKPEENRCWVRPVGTGRGGGFVS